MFLTDISLKRPVFAIVVIIAMLAVGIVSFLGLNINDMPDTNIPYTTVSITLPGASPDQVETKVTKEIEDAVGQIAGVDHITSRIGEGYSMTVVQFDESITADDAAQEVRAKISAIRAELPDDMSEPTISKFDFNELPVVSLAVSGELDEKSLSALVDDAIVPAINAVNGVGSVTTYGLLEREVQIKVDKDRLAALNLTIDQVASALMSDNIDMPSGKVGDDNSEVTIRTYSGMENVSDFNDVIVSTIDGTEIRLGDVAQVIDGYKEKESKSFYNGEECIGIDIVKQSGTNTVVVADNIKSKVAELQDSLPEDVAINVVDDNSTYIRSSVSSVEHTMMEGCILAVLIVFMFLRSAGSTIVSAVSLPISIVTTFAAMKIMGFSLNTMSLMALSLSVGLLVDDAIVVIENIIRHLRMGKNPLQAAKEATSEISLAVLATTLTIVAVFLPMAVTGGILGSFFKEFGLTIAFAVMISLFVSFTLVPLMASRFVKDDEEREPRTRLGRFLVWFNHRFDLLAVFYKKALAIVLENRKKTILITLIVFALSLVTIPVMGMSFIPEEDNGTVTINADLDAGLSLDAAEEKAKQIEEIAVTYPEVKAVYTTIEKDSVSLNLDLADKEERKKSGDDLAAEMRAEIRKIPGLDFAVSGMSSMGNSDKSYSIHIQGEDFDQLLAYSQSVKKLMADMEGAVDVGMNYKAGKPETRIVVDRDGAADLGVAPSSVSSALAMLFNGTTVGQFENGGDRVDVTVSVEESQSTGIDSIDGIYLTSRTTGEMVPIEILTNKEYATASSQIARYDKIRDIELSANIQGVPSPDFSRDFMNRVMEELPPPEGITFVNGGSDQFMQESMGSLMQAIVLGILFIFLILAAQFESWIDPLAIMFSLPLAMIGAMIALFVTGVGLSMVGLIGIIFLFGLVTKNAILLVDFIKTQRRSGRNRTEAILEAGQIRLRPIMMTTLAMILGMMPSALDTGIGSELRQPMAIAIIGGLVSSTLLTLVVIPVIYTILDDMKGKLNLGKLQYIIQRVAAKKQHAPETKS